MSEYKVLITETWKRAVTVDAESREEAEAAVRCQYKKGEYALVSADSDGVSFSAQYPEQQVELSYKENIFFGLSLRQLIFSLLACGVAVGIYLGLRDALGTETVSWLCILGAAPFAAMGFVKYHGMTAEKFFAAWLRSEFLVPKRLTFRPTNLYWEAMQEQRRQEKKRSAVNFGAFVPKFTAAHSIKRRFGKKC